MNENTIALVTGATRGLGRVTVERLAALGWTVVLGARDEAAGKAAADELGVEWVRVDVTDDESVTAAAREVDERHGRLDVLVNNAGIAGPYAAAADTTAADVDQVLATNVVGPIRVTHAFLPLLRRSAAPRIVMVTSGLGSFVRTSDPDLVESTIHSVIYPPSKSALTMIAKQYAAALPELRINAVDPGYTATEFNGNSGPQTVQEGTDAIVEYCRVAPDGPTGGFFDRNGRVPW